MHTLRQAKLEDLPKLLKFEQAVIAAERPFSLNLKPGDIHYYDISELIESDLTCLGVIEIQQQIVACGYAHIRASALHHNSTLHAYLGFMYTIEEYRGQGLNQQLIDYLKKWSLQRGVKHFRLDVFSTNVAAIRAYEKSGFKSHILEMVMEVDDYT